MLDTLIRQFPGVTTNDRDTVDVTGKVRSSHKQRIDYTLTMRILTLIGLAALSILGHAQDIRMKALAPIALEVSYEMMQLCDYPNQWRSDAWYEKSTLRLEIGKGMAHSYVVEEHRELVNQFIMRRDKNRWNVEPFNLHSLLGETFIGYPKEDVLTQVVNLDAAGVFQYVEPVPTLKWKVLPKSKTILGYDCQCATVTFRGREYEAWFTIDIPLGYGPWKFQGLPGLILEVRDLKNEFHFTANGIEQVKGEKDILMFDEEMRSIKRVRALKMEQMLHKDHTAYAADYGITYRLSGAQEHNAQPYFPIELE